MLFRRGTKHEEQRKESEHSETGRRNPVGTERKTDSDDHLPETDCSGDYNINSSGKMNDTMDIDMVEEVGSDDDDYDYSGKGYVDDSDFSDSGKPEVDSKNKQAGHAFPKQSGVRWSVRIAGGISESFVENGNLGTKNRSRQRPIRNSALEAIVVPDSEDDS